MSAAPLPSSNLVANKVRGTIIKVPDATPGLLMISGKQKQFTLEGVWKSPSAPAPNATVEVELDAVDNITSITVVDAAQLARERFQELSGKVGGKIGEFSQGQAKDIVHVLKSSLGDLTTRMGSLQLGAAVILWISLFFLPGYKIELGFAGSQTFTLWDFIGLNLSLGGGIEITHGFWGLIGFFAILAPLVTPFMAHPLARYANALTLAYFVVAIFAERSSLAKILEMPGIPSTGLDASIEIRRSSSARGEHRARSAGTQTRSWETNMKTLFGKWATAVAALLMLFFLIACTSGLSPAPSGCTFFGLVGAFVPTSESLRLSERYRSLTMKSCSPSPTTFPL